MITTIYGLCVFLGHLRKCW